jgi:DNA-directed RNA polymerase alpha subunit
MSKLHLGERIPYRAMWTTTALPVFGADRCRRRPEASASAATASPKKKRPRVDLVQRDDDEDPRPGAAAVTDGKQCTDGKQALDHPLSTTRPSLHPPEPPPLPRAEIEELTDDFRAVVRVRHMDRSVANSLRRIMIAEVPTLAIEDVYIESNDCLFGDAELAFHLGMIPLESTTAHRYLLPHECDCATTGIQMTRKGTNTYCPKCAVFFRLQVKNISERTNRRVTTHDLRPVDEACLVVPAHTDEADPRSGITIVVLEPGEEINLEAVARKGTGKIHGKWAAHTSVAFKSPARVRLNHSLVSQMTVAQQKAMSRACHEGVILFATGTETTTSSSSLSSLSSLSSSSSSTSPRRESAKDDPSATASPRTDADSPPPPLCGATAQNIAASPALTGEAAGSARGAVLLSLTPDAARRCTYCQSCVHEARAMGLTRAVSIQETPREWVFQLGTTGCMPPLHLFQESVRVFMEKLENLKRLLLQHAAVRADEPPALI